MVFLQLRQQTETLQAVVALSKEGEEEVVSKQMIKWVNGVLVSKDFDPILDDVDFPVVLMHLCLFGGTDAIARIYCSC